MCGIFGQYNRHGADPQLIERMAHSLRHRGPDGYGTYHHESLAFGAGRLAIIDLAAGVQPIFNEDRSISVVFNGEIYNYHLLRTELEAAGHVFSTHTDTEVIVHGYESWGVDVINRLRGMFAIGIWDQSAERLLLARDRMGEKPLYYAQYGDDFLFASEIKALFEFPALPKRVNGDAVPLYLSLGYVPAPATMFEGIKKLGPGELLIIEAKGTRLERYWQPVMDATRSAIDYEDAVVQVRKAVTQAVEMRLMSDVPLGAFLSGGLDSTIVVAIMSRLMGRPVDTFTVGFDFSGTPDVKNEQKFNVDARFAELASQRLNTNHHAINIKADDQLAALLPHLVYAMDEPIGQPSIIQTAYVSAIARGCNVPVMLTGDGSDELFAGYDTYQSDRVLDRYMRVPSVLRRQVTNPIFTRLPDRPASLRSLKMMGKKARFTDPSSRYLSWSALLDAPRIANLVADAKHGHLPTASVADTLNPVLARPKTNYFADRIAYTGLSLWIPEDSNMRVDKMAMAMSIETRAPFEDHELVSMALKMPLSYKLRNGDFKSVLKAAFNDIVPPEILNRPKWGFFPPVSTWLRTVSVP
jgi:asparagine synthase (glutamine-hydrolysing)